MVRLIHISRGPDLARHADLSALDAAHLLGRAGQLSGVRLLYCEQVLEGMEGPRSVVLACHGAICSTAHYRAPRLLAFHGIGAPQWTDWSVREVAPTPANDERLARSLAEILGGGNPIGARLALNLIENLAARGKPLMRNR